MGLSGLAKTVAGKLALHLDAWENSLTGLGTTRDKRLGNAFFGDAPLQPQELEQIYHGDDMAARAVGKIVEEALKKGILLHSSDEENAAAAKADIKRVETALRQLDFVNALGEAAEWGRLYGGGVILLGADGGGDPAMPLVDERVRQLRFLTVLDRRDLQPITFYDDPLSPKYGQVQQYRITPIMGSSSASPVQTTRVVHETRLLIFRGVRTSKRMMRMNTGWSYSVLQRMYEVLRDFNQAWGSVAHLMTDANQGVYKLKGFLDIIASGDTTDFDTRMRMLDSARSVAQAIVVDADNEDFERKPTTFTGLPDLLDRFVQRMAAAAGMPVTKLMGISPAGLNATGEHDESSWYDSVASYQEQVLKDPAQRIVLMVARTIGVKNPETIEVCFPPLKQETPLEKAQRRKTVFEGDQIAITQGIYIPEEVALVRSKDGQFSDAEPVIDLDVRRAALEKELDQMEEQAGQPDPAPPQLMAQGGGGESGSPPTDKSLPPAPPPADGQKVAAGKSDHIEQRGNKWVLLSKKTGRVIGEFETRAEAVERERAILAAEHEGG